MTEITKDEMDVLIKLQAIETESGKIRSVLDGIDSEINIRKGKARDAENLYNEADGELAEIKKEYREFEDEVNAREDRLRKSEDYLKVVKTNTEYQTLLREIDDNKKKNSEVEAQMIEMLDAIESKEKEVHASKESFENINVLVEKEVAEILENSVAERKELEKITKIRDEIAEKVKPALLKRFNNILEQSSGRAIVPVVNSICQGCYMNIPPQQFIEIQRGGALMFCPQCHRIVYYAEDN